jgi:hypothetical protein
MPNPQQKSAQTRQRNREAKEARERAAEQEAGEAMLLLASKREAFPALESELLGLYDEIDKLAKKAPNEPVTNLQLKIINNVISKSKAMLAGDTFIDEVEIFVAAGDNPEYRDALTVLRQIRQGLDRFRKNDQIFKRAFQDELDEWDFSALPDFFTTFRETP